MARRMGSRRDYLIEVSEDGLPTAEIGPWAADKYRRSLKILPDPDADT